MASQGKWAALVLAWLGAAPAAAIASQVADDPRRAFERSDLSVMRSITEARERGDNRKAAEIAEALARRCDTEVGDPQFCSFYWTGVAIEARYAFDDALVKFARAKAALGSKPRTTIPTDALDAYSRIRSGDPALDIAAASRLLQAEIANPVPASDIEQRQRSQSLSALAMLAAREGNWSSAVMLFEDAVRMGDASDRVRATRERASPNWQQGQILLDYAQASEAAKRWPDAERVWRRYLALPSAAGRATYQIALADAVLKQGRRPAAIALFRAAIMQAAAGETAARDPWLAREARRFAELLAADRNGLPEARHMLRFASAIAERRLTTSPAFDQAAMDELRSHAPIFRAAVRINWRLSRNTP